VPPQKSHRFDCLEAALRSGLPVVIWPRDSVALDIKAELSEYVKEDTPFNDLPDIFLRMRREASTPKNKNIPHIGRSLLLLWDDQTRQPKLGEVKYIDSKIVEE
jgi:vWA-MoxR associated protein C-terminal domain